MLHNKVHKHVTITGVFAYFWQNWKGSIITRNSCQNIQIIWGNQYLEQKMLWHYSDYSCLLSSYLSWNKETICSIPEFLKSNKFRVRLTLGTWTGSGASERTQNHVKGLFFFLIFSLISAWLSGNSDVSAILTRSGIPFRINLFFSAQASLLEVQLSKLVSESW